LLRLSASDRGQDDEHGSAGFDVAEDLGERDSVGRDDYLRISVWLVCRIGVHLFRFLGLAVGVGRRVSPPRGLGLGWLLMIVRVRPSVRVSAYTRRRGARTDERTITEGERGRPWAGIWVRNEVAPGHAWDAYLPVSMMGCTWELTSELSDRLSSRGLLAFLGMKRPTLEAAALLGLAAGASVPVSELPATFERFLPGPEPESVLGWFRERAAADGYPQFRLHDNVLVAQI
jgi:hypothetical protein